MSLAPALPPRTLDRLRGSFTGGVVLPSDPDYDAAREVFYPGFSRHPAAIVRPADAADVAKAISLAGEDDLDLFVRGGGHSVAGHTSRDGVLVLDLRDLRGFVLAPGVDSAWTGGGTSAGAYTLAAAEHGLATSFGDAGTVSVGGMTVGGGIGFLSRQHGLTLDHLLAAEVVTADGTVRYVDAAHEPDLFWGLRGGGGNLGVVTRLRLRLHPVSGVVAGELIMLATPETIAGFVAAADAAPRTVSTIANIMVAPPMPMVPEHAHGRQVIYATIVHTGDEAAAARDLAAFRDLADPLLDTIAARPYASLYGPEERFPLSGWRCGRATSTLSTRMAPTASWAT